MSTLAQDVGGVAYSDSSNFTVETVGLPQGGGGAAYADSANFTLDTAGFPGGGGGVAFADSGNCTVDTSGFPIGGGGVAFSDSGNFTLDTTGLPAGGGRVTFADSGNFNLDTVGLPPMGIGGVTFADSGSFTLDTDGLPSGIGGVAFADSGSLTLDTVGFPPGLIWQGWYVWTNTAGGNWSVAANWSPNGVPGPNDAANITSPGVYAVTNSASRSVTNLVLGGTSGTQTLYLPSGTLSVTGPSSGSAQGVLNINGGVLAGAGPLTLAGALNWSGGTISAGVQFNGGVFSTTSLLLNGGQMTNIGTLAWNNGAELLDGNGSVFTNLSGAVINVKATNATWLYGGNYTGTHVFGNNGTININGSGNQEVYQENLVNSGAINVNSGTLQLYTGTAEVSGAVAVASGATLELAGIDTFTANSSLSGAGNLQVGVGGTASLNNGLGLTGSWTFQGGTATVTGPDSVNSNVVTVSGGAVNFNGNGALTPSTLTVSGGTLAGSQGIVADTLNWSGGIIETGVRFNGGVFSTGNLYLDGGQMTNSGVLTWNNGAELLDGNGSMFTNVSGAVINVNVTNGVWNNGGNYTGTHVFGNNGTININGSGNQEVYQENLVNSGAINVNSGTLQLYTGTAEVSGAVAVASGATLELAGIDTFTANSSLSGAGNLQVGVGGTASLNNGLGLTGSWTFQGGTATVTGPDSANGNVITVSGSGTINFNGNGTLAPSTLTVSGGTLAGSQDIVAGMLNWSGGIIETGVRFNGGVFSTGNLYLDGGQMTNSGTLAWNNGAELLDGNGSVFTNLAGAVINVNVTNGVWNNGGNYMGTHVFGNNGTIDINGSGNQEVYQENLVNSGTVNVDSGTLFLNLGSYNQSAGLTLLNGGNINNAMPLLINGGTLAGNGAIYGSVTNSGSVNPGNPIGQMIIGGNYLQTPSGTLNIALGGTVPGKNFDLLIVSNTAALGGALKVALSNAFYPADNAVFTFLNAHARSNAFANFVYPSNQLGIQTQYTTTSASVQVTSVQPTISFIPNQNIPEQQPFSVMASGSPGPITWSILSGPGGLGINPNTGVISWTPAQTQSPSTNTVVVQASNNGNPPQSSSTSFTITVYEVNIAPVLPVVPVQTVNVLAQLTVSDAATEPNIHASTTGYALSGPTGAGIDSSGVVSWTPTVAQGPSTNLFTVVMTNVDTYDQTNTYLEATNTFMVVVFAPTLAPIGNFTLNAGQTVSFTAAGSDNDATRTLAYSVSSGPGSIGASSGAYTWRPPVAAAGTSTNVQVTVTANSVPVAIASQSFTINVNGLGPVLLTPVSYLNGEFTMQITGPPGPDYVIEYTEDYLTWSNLATNLSAVIPFQYTDAAASNQVRRFYRVQLTP